MTEIECFECKNVFYVLAAIEFRPSFCCYCGAQFDGYYSEKNKEIYDKNWRTLKDGGFDFLGPDTANDV